VDSSTYLTASGTSAQFIKGDGSLDSSKYVATLTQTFRVTTPVGALNTDIWRAPADITITKVYILCMGGTSVTGNLNTYDSNGGTSTAVAGDVTASAGSLNTQTISVAINAGQRVGLHNTSVSGTPSDVTYSFDYQLT
jgi:hypothetical protein